MNNFEKSKTLDKTSQALNITFFSSSAFTIPLIQKLQSISGQTLLQTYNLEKPKLFKYNFNYKIEDEIIQKLLKKYRDYKINFNSVISASNKFNRDKEIFNPVVQYCQKNKIDYFNPSKIKDTFVDLKTSKPELNFGIVASYGQILTQQILDSLEFGIINWHPSLLPKYRGPTPMQTILNNNESATGLSWINMTKGMDAGDILLQTQMQLPNIWTIEEMTTEMVEQGVDTLITAIITNLGYRDITLGLQLGLTQDLELISFTQMLDKSKRMIEPQRLSAEQVFSHYKAYKQFPGTVFYDDYFQQNIKITKTNAVIVARDSFELINQKTNFVQIKVENQSKTCLKTKSGYLELLEIMLENGKKIQLQGYQFKD